MVNLGKVKETIIGTYPTKEKRREFIKLCKEYIDIFTWSYVGMSEPSKDMVSHMWPIDLKLNPEK